MALTDIEKKILAEAEKEAAEILAAAKKEQAEKIKAQQLNLQAEQKQLEKSSQEFVKRTVEQHKQLSELEAGQKLLRLKREYLAEVVQSVQEELLSEKSVQQKFYEQILIQLKPQLQTEPDFKIETAAATETLLKKVLTSLDLSAELIVKTDWQPGRWEIILAKARLDCSLDLLVREKSQAIEAELAKTLFV